MQPPHAFTIAQRAGHRLRAVGPIQIPFMAVMVIIFLTVDALVDLAPQPNAIFLGGVLTAAGTTVLAALLPWESIAHAWIAIIPILDFVAVALVRDAAGILVPGIGGLVFFPVLWLAYEFAAWTVWFSILGSLFVGVFPFLRGGDIPSTPLGWAKVLMLPVTATGIAISVRFAAERLSRHRDTLKRTAADLRSALAAEEQERLALSAIEDTVDAAITVIDTSGRIVRRNRLALDFAMLAGAESETANPVHVHEGGQSTEIPASPAAMAQALIDGPLNGRTLWIGVPPNQVAVMVRSRVVEGEDGQPFGTVVIAHDVTRLLESIRVRETFLTTVSHELRTPLTAIVGYLDLVVDKLEMLGAEPSKEVAAIERNVDRLLALVADLLLAGGSAAAVKLVSSDVVPLVIREIDAVRHAADAAGVRLEFDPPAGFAAVIDAVQIRHVVSHLLGNAVKFSESGGAVRVLLQADAASWSLVVADDGIGIDLHEQSQIFERFYRADEADRRAIQGAGLGLAISHAVIDAHGGRITVDSLPGRGSTFTVTIPRSGAAG
ncbi:sensor histidine kinase [Plantibacter sp. Mn2098]|uniref:sensor histidine kinase n=1 Tax=Plantibacter sp. Mn2098 TaxID=3395266 RepID=UPI003BE03D27